MHLSRALSIREKILWLCSIKRPFNMVSTLKWHGKLNCDDIPQALAKLKAQHPMLQSIVKGLSFAEAAQAIPFRLHHDKPGLFEKLYIEHLSFIYDGHHDVPMLVLYVIQHDADDYTFLFAIDHCFSDGQSFAALLQDFFAYLRGAPQKAEELAECLPMSDLWVQLPTEKIQAPDALQFGEACDIEMKVHLNVLPLRHRFSLKETAAIKALTKKQKVRMHSLLSAVLCQCYQRHVANHRDYALFTPVDARRFMGRHIPASCLSNFATGLPMNIDAKGNENIDTMAFARQIATFLEEHLTEEAVTNNLYNFDHIYQAGDEADDINKKSNINTPTVALSNLGVVDMDDDNLVDLSFTTANPFAINNPDVFWGVAFTWKNQLYFDLIYPNIHKELGQILLNEFARELLALA